MHDGGLQQVQGERAGLLAVAIGAGELTVFAVEDAAVGRVPLLDDVEASVDFPAQARLDHTLVTIEAIEELASRDVVASRMGAAILLEDLGQVAPAEVPLGLLARLALPSKEDWYVQAPAMALTEHLMLHRPDARVILDGLSMSTDANDRFEAARALVDLCQVDPAAVPSDLAKQLAKDPEPVVAAEAKKVSTRLKELPKNAYFRRFRPFAI